MIYNHEISRLRETKSRDAVLAIMVSVPDNGSLPTSDVYLGSFDESEDSGFCFWTNSTVMDVAMTLSNQFWCVDNEGHVFTTSSLVKAPLAVLEDVSFGYKKEYLSQINAYRFSELPINTLWCNERLTIVADESGTVFHIESDKVTSYSLNLNPLSFFGSTCDDLYIYGRKAKLWHFNGRQWTEILLPDVGLDYFSISGGITLSDGDVVFVTSYGFVFKGNAKTGFKLLSAPKKPYSGISQYQGRYFVSVKDEGLFEITGIDSQWQFHLISQARFPLSLDTMGNEGRQALFMSSSLNVGKPYFVIVEPGNGIGEKERAYSWEINIE
ncbi:hypothetical protein [Vibrio owensii]|uniref:hypothetical protein n=1 Tax=Vibrio owensii TaxID=696485 RepID=UPI0022DD7675|nr:hypothetical protein [Vibrio owensii]MDA0382959.1 hypothetical protein [Vibrio owensii]